MLEYGGKEQLGDPPASQSNFLISTNALCDLASLSFPPFPPSLPPSLHLTAQPSSSSGFYILNDWQSTFSEDTSSTASLPATAISNIMLKTLGILRVH